MVENLLAQNLGTNKFQQELETFILKKFTTNNLQDFTDLMKGLSVYLIKTPELEEIIYQTLDKHVEEFTLKQLESLIWSMSRNIKHKN